MTTALFSLVLLVAAAVQTSRQIVVRASFPRGASVTADSTIIAPLLRGVFADSTLGIVGKTRNSSGMKSTVVILEPTVVQWSDSAVVSVRAYNILHQPVASGDTIRVARSEVDSAMSVYGQRLAIQLRQRIP